MEVTQTSSQINKQKRYFYAYELIGTSILTLAYNLSSLSGGQPVLLVISLWSWEISCAHFNVAVTLGSLLFHSDLLSFKNGKETRKNLMQFFLIIVCQFFGSLFGIFLTFAGSKIIWPVEDTDQKSIYPEVPNLCPSVIDNQKHCDQDHVLW